LSAPAFKGNLIAQINGCSKGPACGKDGDGKSTVFHRFRIVNSRLMTSSVKAAAKGNRAEFCLSAQAKNPKARVARDLGHAYST
jgi:hypothetical protein